MTSTLFENNVVKVRRSIEHPIIKNYKSKKSESTRNRSLHAENMKHLLKKYTVKPLPNIPRDTLNKTAMIQSKPMRNVSSLMHTNEPGKTEAIKTYLQERSVLMRQLKTFERKKVILNGLKARY